MEEAQTGLAGSGSVRFKGSKVFLLITKQSRTLTAQFQLMNFKLKLISFSSNIQKFLQEPLYSCVSGGTVNLTHNQFLIS